MLCVSLFPILGLDILLSSGYLIVMRTLINHNRHVDIFTEFFYVGANWNYSTFQILQLIIQFFLLVAPVH